MRRTTAVLGLVLALVASFVYVLFRAASEPVTAPAPAPRPTDSTWPLVIPVAEQAPAAPISPPGKPVPEEDDSPDPFVPTFAGRSTTSPLPPVPSPTATLSIPVNVDGCDHAYGARSQCVPWRFPPGAGDRCSWLRERGFLDEPLTVRGADRHRLDPDGDGTACDP